MSKVVLFITLDSCDFFFILVMQVMKGFFLMTHMFTFRIMVVPIRIEGQIRRVSVLVSDSWVKSVLAS